jgi:hypothetical protein
LDGGDGTEIAIDHAEVGEAGFGRVGVSVDKAGENGFGGEIDSLGSRGSEVKDVVVGTDGEDAIAGDGDGLSEWPPGIDGVNGGAMENEVGLLFFEREEGEGSERAEKFPTIRRSGHGFLVRIQKNGGNRMPRRDVSQGGQYTARRVEQLK